MSKNPKCTPEKKHNLSVFKGTLLDDIVRVLFFNRDDVSRVIFLLESFFFGLRLNVFNRKPALQILRWQ